MNPLGLLSHAVRAKEILAVLARHGFADFTNQLDLPAGFWKRLLAEPAPVHTIYERGRLAAEELGPTFVKLGQFLSMRPDILPQPLILELRKLQDSVPALPFSVMRPVLTEEIPPPLDGLFIEFDETPVASASLAQVYFARLQTTGEPVAIKVQKPDLRRKMEIDLDLAVWLAGLVQERIPAAQAVDLGATVAEARPGVLRELDFLHEAMKVAANRIALGVIIGSLIIGSSLVIITGIQPHLFGYPALGIVGYLLSAVLGLYVVWDIIRHGRHK